MRVSDEGGARARRGDPVAVRSRGRFVELLRRHAAAAGIEARAARRQGEAPGPPGAARGDQPVEAGEGPAVGRRPGPARAGRGPAPLEPCAEPAGAPARGPGASATTVPAAASPTPEPARATLALAVRALPPTVEAFRLGGREALSIDFGRALGVELRQRPGGVELSLAAAAALAPAARAELPGLLRALATRGVTVLRAEVRERGAGCGAARERR